MGRGGGVVGVMDMDSSDSIILFSSQSILFTRDAMNGVR